MADPKHNQFAVPCGTFIIWCAPAKRVSWADRLLMQLGVIANRAITRFSVCPDCAEGRNSEKVSTTVPSIIAAAEHSVTNTVGTSSDVTAVVGLDDGFFMGASGTSVFVWNGPDYDPQCVSLSGVAGESTRVTSAAQYFGGEAFNRWLAEQKSRKAE